MFFTAWLVNFYKAKQKIMKRVFITPNETKIACPYKSGIWTITKGDK
jgi:hypothetical protein